MATKLDLDLITTQVAQIFAADTFLQDAKFPAKGKAKEPEGGPIETNKPD
jgi:hypothetical protein